MTPHLVMRRSNLSQLSAPSSLRWRSVILSLGLAGQPSTIRVLQIISGLLGWDSRRTNLYSVQLPMLGGSGTPSQDFPALEIFPASPRYCSLRDNFPVTSEINPELLRYTNNDSLNQNPLLTPWTAIPRTSKHNPSGRRENQLTNNRVAASLPLSSLSQHEVENFLDLLEL